MTSAIQPAFHPVTNLKTGEIQYFEALSRVADPTKNITWFISTLENYGIIHLLDASIAERIAGLLGRRQELCVGVNVSISTIEHYMGHYLSHVVKHYESIPRLVFEITESMPITREKTVIKFCETIRFFGGRIAIDDFGAGHERHPRLLDIIRPDYVKLDRSFVESIDKDCNRRSLDRVRALLDCYGGALIAESVDTEDKLESVRKNDISLVQGFLFSKVLPCIPEADLGFIVMPGDASTGTNGAAAINLC